MITVPEADGAGDPEPGSLASFQPVSVAVDRMSDHNFNRLAPIIERHVGIRLPESKRTMVEVRLRKRIRALGLGTLNEYCRELFDRGELERELVHVIDAVTTNKTEFFREPEHFEYLRQVAVPRLVAERRAQNNRTLKVWSAACSNGAEPYTAAMVLADLALQGSGAEFAILGTDICTEVLDQAARAVYPEEMMAPVPEEMLRRYVMWSRDPRQAQVRVVPELRRRVHFMRLNLIEPRYAVDRDVDVIFCRNVLIYFDRPTQQAVVSRLCEHLRPGGYLFLGHSESVVASVKPDMRTEAATVLRRC